MNFALLGDDPIVFPLIRALADSPHHRLLIAVGTAGLRGDLGPLQTGARFTDRIDDVLTAGDVDAVLVCGTNETLLEGARQLASAGRTLVIFPRSRQGSTWIYELALVRDEKRIPLIPVFAHWSRPEFGRVREAITSGLLGRVLYLRVDREIVPPRIDDGPALLNQEQIEDALLEDADLLRNLIGDYSRVTAIQTGTLGQQAAVASVAFAAEQLPGASWTVRGARDQSQWRLTVTGEKGELLVRTERDPCRLTVETDRVSLPPDFDPASKIDPIDDPGRQLLRFVDEAVRRARKVDNWTDAVRAFELVDGARISLRRRRAIDVHFETTSERSIFKSQMTAVGCLVITLTLVAVVFLLLVMPLLDRRPRVQKEAERAGSVVPRVDFAEGSAQLTAVGRKQVREVAARNAGSSSPVLIEEGGGPGNPQLDEQRCATVIALLKDQGMQDAAERTQLAPVVGQWYPKLLKVVRLLAFVPLALFLLLQLLVFLARPALR
jgi:predicted dehydrogenase